ncbi:MAG: CoA transferase [Paracoccus sp. BP8]|uniref:CaiB/BaiF CoA transferase family protein n=1 Tax=Paracoccus sp. J39 TaxID=935848 RepID=UPI000490D9EC|nr:CoA transferase [Paracoccus sp. J39]RQP04170.1 MAG: CoA transferase [Paracoccus sp. BP8]
MTSSPLSRPLQGFRVLDLTVALAGPYCTSLLAGLGAEVIRIESPNGNDVARLNPPFFGPEGFSPSGSEPESLSLSTLARNRGKKCVGLNLKSEAGRKIFLDLVAKADLVVENQSEGTIDRLGIGYAVARRINPRIVYASIEGLGEASPVPGLKATDIIVQALSGLADATGYADGPPQRIGLPVADLMAAHFALSGALSALLQRSRTGQGQHVRVSMLDAMVSILAMEHFDVLLAPDQPARSGNHQNRIGPFGFFRARDGHVAIAAPSDKLAHALFAAMGAPELAKDPRFGTRGGRVTNADMLVARIEEWTSTLTAQEVTDSLNSAFSVPCAPVRRVQEVLADSGLLASGALTRLEHPDLGPVPALGPGMPIRFSGAATGGDRPGVALGHDTARVLDDLLGIDAETLARLRADGVV